MFSSACKAVLEKIFFPKKSKISVFFTKKLFSQKLDFREQQTKYHQKFFEIEKYSTFSTGTKQPQQKYIWTKTHRARLKSLCGSLTKCHLVCFDTRDICHRIFITFLEIIL
jgi:hypothetical protein